jgi:hypothetical protein
MDYFAGLDVSVKETSVCIVDDAGKIVREVKVASEPRNPPYARTREGVTRKQHTAMTNSASAAVSRSADTPSCHLSLPKNQIRAYRWCSPPRIGWATMSPNRSIARVQGVSFPRET